MTKKEIEAYKANFAYGRKCWIEFLIEHPPGTEGKEKDKHEERVEGDPPF